MSRRGNPKIFGPPPIQAELPMRAVPPSLLPTTELVTKAQLVARHSHLLSVNRVTWALRCRAVNGLTAAVFDSPCGELLIDAPQAVLPGLVPWAQRTCQAARRAPDGAPAAGTDGHREQSWRARLKKQGFPLRTAGWTPLGGTAPGPPPPASRGALGDWYAHLVRFQGFVASDTTLEEPDIRIYN